MEEKNKKNGRKKKKQIKTIKFVTFALIVCNLVVNLLVLFIGTGAFLMGSSVSLDFDDASIVSSYDGGIICFSIIEMLKMFYGIFFFFRIEFDFV